jgi:hypothetical protein
MLKELLKIFELLHDELCFYLDDGPLKDRLIESYMAKDEAHPDFLDYEHQVSIRIKPGMTSTAPTFDYRLEISDFTYHSPIPIDDLNTAEFTEMIELLRPFCHNSKKQKKTTASKIIRRKKHKNHLDIASAANILELSQRQLKTLIPCSTTRISDINGRKNIEEYYWEKDLIYRFNDVWSKHQQGRGYNREDVDLIATTCCDNDRLWARDCIEQFIDQRLLKENKA